MNNFTKYLLVSIIFFFSAFSNAVTIKADNTKNNEAKITAIQSELINLKDNLKENQSDLDKVRNDEINYKIEKDLLKETYSSSFSTVNTVVSVIFALVTLFGYLVFRNIKEIQSEYKKELDNVKDVKKNFDFELEKFKSKQTEYESEFARISKTNDDQNQRLKTLELIEKVSKLVNNKSYGWALPYINIGLNSDPNNHYLLSFKAECHGKLGEFAAFIETNKKRLDLDSNDVNKPEIALNLLEGYAITNQVDEFNNLYSKYKVTANKDENRGLMLYLNTILKISSGDILNAQKELKNYAEQYPSDLPCKHLGEWSFDEVTIYINGLKDEKCKSFMLKSFQFFNGDINSKEFIESLNQFSLQT